MLNVLLNKKDTNQRLQTCSLMIHHLFISEMPSIKFVRLADLSSNYNIKIIRLTKLLQNLLLLFTGFSSVVLMWSLLAVLVSDFR